MTDCARLSKRRACTSRSVPVGTARCTQLRRRRPSAASSESMVRPTERLSWRIASITGHRQLSPVDRRKLWGAMKGLVSNKTVDAIYFGGARGADTEALKAALRFREGTRPWLVVVVPDTVEAQPIDTHPWTRKADEVIELRNPITQDDGYGSFKTRNKYLVDIASFVVAFWNGDYKSGTGHAVRLAEKDGLVVYKIEMSGKP